MNFLRVFVAILVIQSATALLSVVAFRQDSMEARLALVAPALVLALVAALWFSSLVGQQRRLLRSRLEERFRRERQKLHARAEQERSRLEQQSQRRVDRERDRIQARANRKVALAVGGLVAVGGVILFTQFMTLGLLLVTGAGSGAAGYLLRARKELKARG